MKAVLFSGGLGHAGSRMLREGHLMAYKYEGLWRAMDTLRNRQDMVEQGEMPCA